MDILKIGLTGGIGTGKTTVASMLEYFGAEIIDADEIVEELLRKNAPGYRKVLPVFGEEILDDRERIDRKKLAKTVFSSDKKRRTLNAMIHPLVREEESKILQDLENGTIAVTEAALLIETGGYKRYDRIILAACPRIKRMNRLLEKGMDKEDIEKRMNAQMSEEEKEEYSDFIVDNSGSRENTRAQVKDIFEELEQILKGKD